MGIVAYNLETVGDYTMVQRCADGVYSEVAADTFREAVEFLVQPCPADSLSIVWNLDKASKVLFGMMPDEDRKKYEKATKFWFDDVKVFWTGSILGLTTNIPLQGKGNQCEKVEVNLYSLNKWLAEDREEPRVVELAKLGYQVLSVLEKWGISPTKLTSPVGLYSSMLETKVPTVFSSPKIMDAANYCLPVMDLEWQEEFETSALAPTYKYDLRSAYGSEMVKLPNTDKCRIQFSKFKLACDWAILRVAGMNPPKLNPLVTVDRDKYTSEELAWVKRHGGTYDILDGFYITFTRPMDYPYRQPVEQLYQIRRDTDTLPLEPEVAKRTVNGIGGKFTQQNKSDGKLGELYNPILGTMMKSRVRLKCMAFIEENHMQQEIVRVHVDSVQGFMDLRLPEDAGMGEWRQVRE